MVAKEVVGEMYYRTTVRLDDKGSRPYDMGSEVFERVKVSQRVNIYADLVRRLGPLDVRESAVEVRVGLEQGRSPEGRIATEGGTPMLTDVRGYD